jgi:hypothetical protein
MSPRSPAGGKAFALLTNIIAPYSRGVETHVIELAGVVAQLIRPEIAAPPNRYATAG